MCKQFLVGVKVLGPDFYRNPQRYARWSLCVWSRVELSTICDLQSYVAGFLQRYLTPMRMQRRVNAHLQAVHTKQTARLTRVCGLGKPHHPILQGETDRIRTSRPPQSAEETQPFISESHICCHHKLSDFS